MKVRRSMLKDLVTVTTRTGDGPYGPTYGAAQLVVCSVDETRRMVRDSSGDEAVSESTLTLHPVSHVVDEDGALVARVNPLELFTPESPVTIDGRASRVLSVKRHRVRSSTVWVEVTCA